jgi:hypothetical protein
VLQLEFAKKAEAKPRQIKIGVGSTTTERKQAEGAKTA